jgi:hypothetical protein
MIKFSYVQQRTQCLVDVWCGYVNQNQWKNI